MLVVITVFLHFRKAHNEVECADINTEIRFLHTHGHFAGKCRQLGLGDTATLCGPTIIGSTWQNCSVIICFCNVYK